MINDPFMNSKHSHLNLNLKQFKKALHLSELLHMHIIPEFPLLVIYLTGNKFLKWNQKEEKSNLR